MLALTEEHLKIEDLSLSREYFRQLKSAVYHLPELFDKELETGKLDAQDAVFIAKQLKSLFNSVSGLSMKYLISGKIEGPLKDQVVIDTKDSGFPAWHEFATMANDLVQAQSDMSGIPEDKVLRSEMLREIITKASFPLKLQNMMAKRKYLETITKEEVFLPKTNPLVVFRGASAANPNHRSWSVSWSVYDTTINLPVIYLMDVDDSARVPLVEDASTWPELSHHLLAQSTHKLNVATIANGIDVDFKRLHPKRLRRLIIGPLYSRLFTHQEGPLMKAFESCASETDTWVMSCTVETAVSHREFEEGVFQRVKRQVYVDEKAGNNTGYSHKSILCPQRVYQSITDEEPDAFAEVSKYLITPENKIKAII